MNSFSVIEQVTGL